MHTVKSVGGQPVVIRNLPVRIEEKRVLRELRIPRLEHIRELKEEAVGRSIKKAIDRAYGLIQGQGCYRTFRILQVGADHVTIDASDRIFRGHNAVKLLAGCDYATLLATTIGPALEKRIEELQGTEVADAYFLDVVGSWMADYMADRVDAMIQSEIRRNGYNRTMRYSPGYGDWDLSVQPDLLSLVGADVIGLSCTETFILQPRKSVTAVIGWERKS
ncbi:MAG: hypothetical protein ACE5HU_00650 [Acidobacteriota bacterium]